MVEHHVAAKLARARRRLSTLESSLGGEELFKEMTKRMEADAPYDLDNGDRAIDHECP
ncbi:hypothetical protein [Nocardia grenadensis]